MRFDFGLYRETLGKYFFEGRPWVYYNARIGPTERALLETHEHDHWELANSTRFGFEQRALAEAAEWKKGHPIAEELKRCLGVSIEFSRLPYEASALQRERTFCSLTGLAAAPDWYSLLEVEAYGDAQAMLNRWLPTLPYPPNVLGSIASNAASLCLDAVSFLDETKSDRSPITARDPKTLRADDVRTLLAQRSPDSLFRALCEALSSRPDVFARLLDKRADKVIREAGFPGRTLREFDRHDDLDPIACGRLIFEIFESLRLFAEDSGAISGTQKYDFHHVFFNYWYADWLGKLLDLSGTPTPPGIPVGPPSAEDLDHVLKFFGTVYTVVGPPARDPATDLPIPSWEPVHKAFRAFNPERRKLYVGVTRPATSTSLGQADGAPFRLSAARAVIAPNDGFGWRFPRTRYTRSVGPADLRRSLEETLPYNPAIAVPHNLADLTAGCIEGVGPLPDNVTLGVLFDGVTLEALGREIGSLAGRMRVMSHLYSIGPAEVRFFVTFCVADVARFFLYAPLSQSMLAAANGRRGIMDIPGHETVWDLDDVPMTARFQAASALICEQYLVNGV